MTLRLRFLIVVAAVIVIAAVAGGMLIPGYAHDQAFVDESRAAATLKHAIAAAQAQAKQEKVADEDRDGVPEHLPLAALIQRGLLPLPGPPAADGAVTSNGYRFSVHLPPGSDAAATDARERHFIAYAWPADAASTRRRFAIDERGGFYAMAGVAGMPPPAWDALTGGRAWGSEAAAPWKPYRK